MTGRICQEAEGLRLAAPSPIRDLMDEVSNMKKWYDDIVSFCAGEPDFPTPEPIKRETIRALESNDTHYASSYGVPALLKIISERIERKTGCRYDSAGEIMITCGAAEAINNVLFSFLDTGDEVLIFTPAFITYKNLVLMCGAKAVEVPLKWNDNYMLDIEMVKKLTTERTRAIILNNPCNPTGAVFEESDLRKLCDWAKEKNLIIISDEIYADIVYDGKKAYSIAAFPDMKDRLILINGFSKTYAMTGWRIGYVAADRKFMDSLLKFHTYCTTCAPTFLQSGLAAGLADEETQKAVDRMIETFARRRKMALRMLSECRNLRYSVPYGAFYILVDVSETGMNGKEFSENLLKEKHVAVVPASAMGAGCESIIRISYACSSEMIKEGLSRIQIFQK